MINIKINNQEIQVDSDMTILEACKILDIDIPTFCHDDRLKAHGSCRICVVEVENSKKLLPACSVKVKKDMVIKTHSKRVMRTRKEILELMWAVHDNDCLSCQKAGNCDLQDYCFEYGVKDKVSEYDEELTNHIDKTNGFYTFDRDKCILCTRCIRMCSELQCSDAIALSGRSTDTHVTHPFELGMTHSSCVSCGNCVDVCPTGALMENKKKEFREWNVEKKVKTTCVYCGVGCQIELVVKNNKVVRVDPVRDAVNKGLLCVKGKFAFNFIDHPNRLTVPLIRKNGVLEESTWEEAYDTIVNKITTIKKEYGSDAFAGFSSAKCTTEDNYVIQKMFRAVLGTNNIDHCARL